ncbi:MAG: DUF4178 domain-containing protein [Chloroflexota bacterium]|nr:DUF4178 domain-containing protein [Dehalococcoidia bacterium]MDW8254060.1 DUF4178 domain-containing protein [Chloroflexota bacterium]
MERRSLSCPACGGPVSVASRFTSLVVCAYCGQTLVVRDTALDPTGKTAKLAEPLSRLRVGSSGTIAGRRFETLGRVRYRYERGIWDEWFLRFDDGQPAWLSEDEGEYVLYGKRRLTAPVPSWDKIRVGATVEIPPHRMFVTEKGTGHVLGAEGELAMTAPPGATFQYVDGNAGGRLLVLVFTENGITFGVGDPYAFHDIAVT